VTFTLAERWGQVLPVWALGATPQKVKVVYPNDTALGFIALKDAQTLGYLEGVFGNTVQYPLTDATGSNLQAWTRVVTP